MSREIEFRAWDNDKKQMGNIVAMDWYQNGEGIVSAHLLLADGSIDKVHVLEDYGDDIVFMEYTGLKAAYKTKMFENDILKDPDDGSLWEVIFDEGGY